MWSTQDGPKMTEDNRPSPTTDFNTIATTHPLRQTLNPTKILSYTPFHRIRFFLQVSSFFPQGFLRHLVLAPLFFTIGISAHINFLYIITTCPCLDKLVSSNHHTTQCHQ